MTKSLLSSLSEVPTLSNPAPECFTDHRKYVNCYVEMTKSSELLMDEIADSTEYILGDEACKAFVSVLSDCGIETADQFVDSFCVEYEGIVESDEFVVIVFNGNTYFFRRLCGVSQRDNSHSGPL